MESFVYHSSSRMDHDSTQATTSRKTSTPHEDSQAHLHEVAKCCFRGFGFSKNSKFGLSHSNNCVSSEGGVSWRTYLKFWNLARALAHRSYNVCCVTSSNLGLKPPNPDWSLRPGMDHFNLSSQPIFFFFGVGRCGLANPGLMLCTTLSLLSTLEPRSSFAVPLSYMCWKWSNS